MKPGVAPVPVPVPVVVVVVIVAAEAVRPHPHAFITTLPSTNADNPGIVSELQIKKK